jgi:methionyl-tRNA formyltransferase
MEKVLIIIDNVVQYDKIKRIFQENANNEMSFEFMHSNQRSEIWNHEDFYLKDKAIDVNEEILWILNNFTLVISVHCFQFFPKELVNKIRCINIHPGYNPINRGWYPQVFSIINDLPIGATIHEMDEKLDNGPIIARQFVNKEIDDTSYSLYHKVLDTEINLFAENFNNIINNLYEKISPEGSGNFFSKRNFVDLCQLDLNKTGTFNDFYNLLRALSHDKYRNAFFIDKNGRKVYLKLDVSR